MLENQSFDRLFGTFSNANQNTAVPTVAGLPRDGQGHFTSCLVDPRQPDVHNLGGTPSPTPWPRLCSYIDDNTPTPTPTGTLTPPAIYEQNNNPHDAAAYATDITGVPAWNGTIPTPMTGFLATAWQQCGTQYLLYAIHDLACLSGASYVPGTPTPAPFDVMRTLDNSNVPTYWYYARYYTLQDHMFEPVSSYSLPSHLFQVSNWSATCPLDNTPTPTNTPIPGQPTATATNTPLVWNTPTTPFSGTPTVCMNEPATPPLVLNLPFSSPPYQPYPNYAWTDITYLLNHHQVYANASSTPIPSTTPGAFCGTNAQGTPGVYINAQGTPIPTTTPGSCVAAPIDWRYYIADETRQDCPGYTPFCNPVQQSYFGTIDAWNPLEFFTTVHTEGTPGPGTPTPAPGANSGQLGNIQQVQYFATAVAGNSLPPVSWVVPPFVDSDHPPFTHEDAELWLYYLITWLATGPAYQWNHTAVVVAWDDWGGFYDHLNPPTADSNGYGFRVPSLIISPWAKHCYVDTQPMSFDAYNKFVEDLFLNGQRIDPHTDGRADLRPDVRELGLPTPTGTPAAVADLRNDFDWNRSSTYDTQDTAPQTPTAGWCNNN
jgi:phospholipase C